MSEWKEYKLSNVCKKIGSGSTPRGGGDTYLESGEYALIRSQNILDFKFSFNGLAYISKKQADELNNVIVEKNDVLVNITGDSVARVCQPPKDMISSRVNQHVAIIRPDESIIDSTFLKYFMLNPSFKEHMLMLSSSGATRNALTKGMIEGFIISAPNLNEQGLISAILSSLDDKIELNNKINKNLENLAQTLFKRWFIDFEFPDEKGKPYKSSGGKMLVSELDEIPEGWTVNTLRKICDISKINVKPFNNSSIEYFHYSLPAFDDGKLPVKEMGGGIKSSKFKVLPKSVLVSKLNPRFPRVWYVNKCMETAICSTEFQILKPKADLYFEFVYSYCKSSLFTDSLTSKASGTSGSHQRVRPDDMINLLMALPGNEVFEQYKNTTSEMFRIIESNITENLHLANLRNTILPKLMSGELEVKEFKLQTIA